MNPTIGAGGSAEGAPETIPSPVATQVSEADSSVSTRTGESVRDSITLYVATLLVTPLGIAALTSGGGGVVQASHERLRLWQEHSSCTQNRCSFTDASIPLKLASSSN